MKKKLLGCANSNVYSQHLSMSLVVTMLSRWPNVMNLKIVI